MTKAKNSSMRPARTVAMTVAAVVASQLPSHAAAQSQGARADDEALAEVIVTARKRAERLLDVPVSITAVSGEDIAARGTLRLRDLSESIPNVVFTGPRDSVSLLTVRGVQSQARVNVGFDSGVGVYVDGVAQGRAIAFNQELVDIERVEFLRGPQGTLFGKNSISGAVSITTRKPSEAWTAEFGVDVGDYNLAAGSAYVSGPIVPGKLAFSASVFKRERDGYVRNIFSGRDVDDDDVVGGRAKLLWTASDAVDVTLGANFLNDNQIAVSSQAITGYGLVAGEFVTNVDQPTIASRDLGGVDLTINWGVGGGTFTSISSYAKIARDRVNDTDAGPLDVVVSPLTNDQKQYSQEIRYASGGEGPLKFVAGAYYFKQDVDSSSVSCFGRITGVPAFLRGVCGDTTGNVTSTSQALFFNADWSFAPAWTLTVGARYTEEDKDLDYLQNGFPFGVAPSFARQQDTISDSDTSPTVGLRWAINPDTNVYLTGSRGFKSGGWNLDNITNATITRFSQLRFDSESAWNYELGLKTNLLDRRLSLNASVFRLDYEDLQAVLRVPVLGGGGALVAIVSNAANAKVDGAELEVGFRPIPNLQLSAAAGYADATYEDYVDRTATGALLDFSGKKLNNAPEWTGSASVQYTLPMGSLEWRFRADLNSRSSVFQDRDNLPTQRLGGWSTTNVRIGLAAADGRWDVTAYADNATDRLYAIERGGGGFAFPGVGTSTTLSYGPPRQFGVRANYRFR